MFRVRNWFRRYLALFLLTIAMVVSGSIALPQLFSVGAQLPPVLVPRVPIDNSTAQQIYNQLPDIPLENQYIDSDTGDPDTDNTLIRRIITYHLLVKGRPPFYRLDWKLTLADYLNANELMFQNAYPGATDLRTNPLAGDRAAITSLTRQQREDLVMALVLSFNPEYGSGATNVDSADPDQQLTEPQGPESSANPTSLPDLPQPGDADLLRF